MEITEEMLYKCAPKAEKLWLSSLPPDDQIPEHKFSQRFEHKMKKLIREQRQSPMMKRLISAAKRIAVVVLVVATISFSGLMTVEAYRAKFIDVITEVFYDLTHFSFFSSWQGDTELGEIQFSYLPEGMNEIRRETLSEPQSQTIYFENSEGRQLKFSQQLVADSTGFDIFLDTEDGTTTTVPFGNYDASLMGDGTSQNSWTPGNEGVRITVVDAESGQPVSTPFDLSSKTPSIKVHFGKVSKIQYADGASISPSTGGYTCKKPDIALPRIISTGSKKASIEEIKKYFCSEYAVKLVSEHTGIANEELIGGQYKLFLEPIAYV